METLQVSAFSWKSVYWALSNYLVLSLKSSLLEEPSTSEVYSLHWLSLQLFWDALSKCSKRNYLYFLSQSIWVLKLHQRKWNIVALKVKIKGWEELREGRDVLVNSQTYLQHINWPIFKYGKNHPIRMLFLSSVFRTSTWRRFDTDIFIFTKFKLVLYSLFLPLLIPKGTDSSWSLTVIWKSVRAKWLYLPHYFKKKKKSWNTKCQNLAFTLTAIRWSWWQFKNFAMNRFSLFGKCWYP